MGRPATAPRKLKDGFYIEVCQKGARNGIKIWCQSEERMLRAAEDYRRSKDVIVLGEHINGKWVSELKPKKLEREKAAQERKLMAAGVTHPEEKKISKDKVAVKKDEKIKTEKKVTVKGKTVHKKPAEKKSAPKKVVKKKSAPKQVKKKKK